jgi:lipid kinase YegS
MKIRLLIHALKAENPAVGEAVTWIRQHRFFALDVHRIEDPARAKELVEDAVDDGIERLIIGGGDGTLNLMLNALMHLPESQRPEMAILPIGTANDFARAAGITLDPLEALLLAIDGQSTPIDAGQVNERYFLNVASGGFGAQVTTETPPELKALLGGAAYALTGLLKLFDFIPIRGRMKIGELEFEGSAFATAVCNGRQAGGGMLLSPDALVNDGLFDIVLYTLDDLPVPGRLAPPTSPLGWLLPFKKIYRAAEVEFVPEEGIRRINLDGEPYEAERFRFRIHPSTLPLVLPEDTPLLGVPL